MTVSFLSYICNDCIICVYMVIILQAISSSVVCYSHTDLHPEWVELARKQLKGADPATKLTWHTPEVMCFSLLPFML